MTQKTPTAEEQNDAMIRLRDRFVAAGATRESAGACVVDILTRPYDGKIPGGAVDRHDLPLNEALYEPSEDPEPPFQSQ